MASLVTSLVTSLVAYRHAIDCRIWAVVRTKPPEERRLSSRLRDIVYLPEDWPRHVPERARFDE